MKAGDSGYPVPHDILEDLEAILLCEECKKREQEEHGFEDEYYEELPHPKKGNKCQGEGGCQRTVE
jgi:hypothetical protein